jgi:hypothetical protein
MKFDLHGLAALFVSALGIASSPAVLHLVSPQAAAIITAAGIVYQACTNPAAAKAAQQ